MALYRDELTAAKLDGVVDLMLGARGWSRMHASWTNRALPCSERSNRKDRPGTLDSASLAIALRDVLLICWTA